MNNNIYDEETLKKIFADNLNYWLKKKNKYQVDIAKHLGVSEATVHFWCKGKKLPRMGKIQSLADYLGIQKTDLIEERKANAQVISMQLYNIPVFESVSAGFGAGAVDYVVDYVALPFKTDAEAADCICIKVEGDSMSPRIENHDLIVVQKQTSVDSGDVAVVLVDQEIGYVKKVEYDEEHITLSSFNPYYPPITFEGPDVMRVMVVGKVKQVIRNL